jgi:hypothetical protein
MVDIATGDTSDREPTSKERGVDTDPGLGEVRNNPASFIEPR